MAVTKLDEFLKDKKEEQFELKGKIYTAKYTGKVILKLTSIYQNANLEMDEQVIKIMECVFGKENADIILDELAYAGIEKVTQAIIIGLGLDSPS